MLDVLELFAELFGELILAGLAHLIRRPRQTEHCEPVSTGEES